MKSIIIVLISILLLTGCTNSVFNKSMEDGKLAIVNSKYEKAESMFSLAAEEKENDKEASSLLLQTKKLIKATKLIEDNKLEEALNLCEEIENIESESDTVKKESSKLKEKIKEAIESINNEKNFIKDEIAVIEALISNKDYSDAKLKLEGLSKNIGENENLKEESDVINNLINTCNEKIREREEAKKAEQLNKISENEAVLLVTNMLIRDNQYVASRIEVDHIDGNNYVVHVYDVIQNEGEAAHTATSGWYYVDMNTGSIKSMF